MKVRVLLFGHCASAASAETLILASPERDEVTAAEVLAALQRDVPSIANALSTAKPAVNERFARPGQRVVESDGCAIIGLVGGG